MICIVAGVPAAPPPPPPGFAGQRRIAPTEAVEPSEPVAPRGPVPSKPMTKLWWQKLPQNQVCGRT